MARKPEGVPMTTRVCLYARFSTDKQNDKSNVDQQRENREHAERMGWTVVRAEEDAEKTGATRFQRPGLRRAC